MIKLIAGLWSGITALIAGMFAFYSRKAGVVTAGLLTFAALTVVFISCINALVILLIGAVSAAEATLGTWLLSFIGMFIPANFALVLGGIVSGRICRAAYEFGRKKTDIVVYGN